MGWIKYFAIMLVDRLLNSIEWLIYHLGQAQPPFLTRLHRRWDRLVGRGKPKPQPDGCMTDAERMKYWNEVWRNGGRP